MHSGYESWVEPSSNTSHSSLSDDCEPPRARHKLQQRQIRVQSKDKVTTLDSSKTTMNIPTRKSVGDGKPRITDNQDDNKINQYIAQIEELTLDTAKVIGGVKPEEFARLLCEIDDLPIRVKFTYLPNSEELHIMSPSHLHEASLIHFSGITHRLISNLHVPSGILTVELNSTVEHPTPSVPDFICSLAHNPGDYAVKWVGEVSFTVSPSATREKVLNLLANSTTIDLAFIVYISEDHQWTSPDDKDPRVVQLRSKGLISREDFLKPYRADEVYTQVDFEEVSWASLGHVTFEVFLRHPDCGFDFESTDAERVARGVLYPTGQRQMDDVGHLFEIGAQRLKQSVLMLMERNYHDPTPTQALRLQRIRTSDPSLDIDWDEWAAFVSQRLCCTAYTRYYNWYTGHSLKRKNPFDDKCGKRLAQTTAQPSNSRGRGSSGSGRGQKRGKGKGKKVEK